MKYITQEEFNKIIGNKREITAEDLVYILESKLDCEVSLNQKRKLTELQKKRMTDFVFTNKDILDQLRKASKEQNYIYDDNEALDIRREARDGK